MVIRLGRGFGDIKIELGHRLRAGTVVPDVKVASAAAEAGIAGLRFLSWHSRLHRRRLAHECRRARARNQGRAEGGPRRGRPRQRHVLSLADMGFTYRHCGVPENWIFTEALYEGTAGDPAEIQKAMEEVAEYREQNQPIKDRTGGSTFKNPPGHSAWKLVDAAGCRGFRVGGAKVSDMHCNFLINDQGASAEDVERLGETVARASRPARA